MIPIGYSLRSLTVRKGTSAATAFGMSLVVFVLASALMLVDGVKRMLSTSGRADNAVVIRQGSGSEQDSVLELASLNAIISQPGIQRTGGNPLAVGEVVALAHLERLDAPKHGHVPGASISFRCTTEAGLAFRPEIKVIEGQAPRSGTNEVMFGKALNRRIRGLKVGDTIMVRNRPLKVVGQFQAAGSAYESEVWGDLGVLPPMFSRQETLSSVRVRLESASSFETFQRSVESNKNLGFHVERENEFFEKQSAGLAVMYGVIGGAIAALAALGALIGAMITMYSAVSNRQREIGTLRALGFSRSNIIISFLIESTTLTVVGGVFGALGSLAMSFVRFSTINMASYSEVVLTFDPSARTIAVAVLAGGALGIFGGLLPAVRAARVSPVAAMRA